MSTKKQIISGVFYTAISKYTGIVISLVVTAILARLLTPDDFGVVAIATVIITFFGIFTDVGIGPAIIQNKDLTDKDLSDIFSFTICEGIVLSILFFLSAGLIGSYYNNETLAIICQLLSINIFLSSINIVPNALLYRDKLFKFIAWRSLTIQLLGGAIAVTAALSGAGLFALIINPIFSALFIFIVTYRREPQKVSFTLGISSIKKIFRYSSYQFLFNVINYFSRNLDKLLIGKLMGMGELGYYEKSYRLMMLPLQNITHVISPVMHPIFSEMQDDLQKLAFSYEKVIKLLAFIGFPLSVFLYFTASEITLLLFGEQWVNSIKPFQVLAISVGIQIIMSTSGSIFQAANDTKSLFICGLFSAILTVSSMLIGIFVFESLEAVAWCICIAFTINFFQCYWMLYSVTFKRNLLFFTKTLIKPITLCIILIITFAISASFLFGLSLIVSACIKGAIFFLVSVSFILVTNEFNSRSKINKLVSKK